MTDERETQTAADPSTEGGTDTPAAPGAATSETVAVSPPEPTGEPAAGEPEAASVPDAGGDETPSAGDGEAEPLAAEAGGAAARDEGGEPEASGEPSAEAAEAAGETAEIEAVAAVAASGEPTAEAAGETAGVEAAAVEAAVVEAAAVEAAAVEAAVVETPAGETPAGETAADEGGDDEAAAPELDDPHLIALRDAKENGATVTGRVIGWNRGGFHVVSHEITAFCPSSEMELGRPRSPAGYVDRDLEFKVVKFQRRGRRVVLSRTELLKEQRQQVLAELAPGTVVKGTVTSLPDFGAFVDLGGVEGLVHVSEISRARVKRPKDALKLGQEVEVKVLKVEEGGERISLSMRELEPDPWQGVAVRYPRGSRFTGKVLRHADFGMFVELEPDVEGLIHVSQLPPGKEMGDETLQAGTSVEGWVREVDAKRQRISLTLREVPEDDPWKGVGGRFPEGEMVEGTVESVAPFGVFINIAPGLTGLLPNSQTGLPRGTNAARAFTPGQQVKVQVLSVDSRRKRISLGKEGSQVEATKADLQEYKKQAKVQEKDAPGAMAAAFARLKDNGE